MSLWWPELEFHIRSSTVQFRHLKMKSDPEGFCLFPVSILLFCNIECFSLLFYCSDKTYILSTCSDHIYKCVFVYECFFLTLHHIFISSGLVSCSENISFSFFWPEGDQELRKFCSSLAAVFTEVYRRPPFSADCINHCATTEDFQALFLRNSRRHHSAPFSLLVECCLSTGFLWERENEGGKWHGSLLIRVLDTKWWNAGWWPQLVHVVFQTSKHLMIHLFFIKDLFWHIWWGEF